jgi:hypothetical protein
LFSVYFSLSNTISSKNFLLTLEDMELPIMVIREKFDAGVEECFPHASDFDLNPDPCFSTFNM